MPMTPDETIIFNNMINDFKELVPDLKIRNQPESALETLKTFQSTYHMSTKAMLKLRKKYTDNIVCKRLNISNDALTNWIHQFERFCMHRGNLNNL